MKVSLRFVLVALFGLGSAWAQDATALRGHYERAVAAAKASYDSKAGDLLKRYGEHVDRLAAEAQAKGELEEVLALQAERKASEERRAPGTGEGDALVTSLRRTLAGHLAQHGQTLTNEWIRIEETYAEALRRQPGEATDLALRASEERLRALKREPAPGVAAPTAKPEPAPELGENILSHGDFDKADSDTWAIHLDSRFRNGTEIFTEPLGDTGGVRNRTLRLDRDRGAVIHVTRGIHIPPGVTELSMTWRARLLKPEREDVAVTGTGVYAVGVKTAPARWSSLTEAQRAAAIYESHKQLPPPSGEAWERYSAILRVDEHINQAFFRVPEGKGQWLVDDLELRPVKPKPEPAKAKPPPPR
jgi:hypothetical protein